MKSASVLSVLLAGFALASSLSACNKTPEPQPEPKPTTSAASTAGGPTSVNATATKEEPSQASMSSGMSSGGAASVGKPGGDPNHGSFTLAEATKDLKGTGPIVATIDTTKGKLQCKLFDDKAPNTVANFIGLATGKRAWRDPNSRLWVNKPAYDGTVFHRIIKGFMIQGGDPRGDGTGEPGYVIPDEIWEGAKHDRAGLLCMANRGHNTNGAQFFITDDAAKHLDGNYTIFGECAPVEVVHDIAKGEVMGDKAVNPVKINSVTISRDEKKK
jgi:peptidyl-prolyl cis-trans isomerase A (cyclophilin A)